jgi:imidazolonepropionase-like amidohydrolase
MKTQRLWWLGVGILAIVGLAPAQETNQALVIRGGTLIDGTGKPPQVGVTILIDAGKIQAVDPHAKVPDRARIIDATGKFIIPGLIDTRVEIGPSPGNRVDRAEVRIDQRLQSLRALLAAGVTTARLFQGDLDEQKLYLRWREEELIVSPRLVLAGPTFTAPRGHPTEQYSIVATNVRRRETREVAKADDAQEKARELAHTGLQVFEAVYDRGSDQEPYPPLAKDALGAVIQEAHGHDLKLFCDVGRSDEGATAVALGADAIEEVSEEVLSDNVLAEMARKQVVFVPVLSEQGDLLSLLDEQAVKAYLAEPIVQRTLSSTMKKSLASSGGMSARVREAMGTNSGLRQLLKQQQDRGFDNVRRARAMGVPLVVGTGSGSLLVFPGAAVHRELELLVQAGLSPLDAIVAATRNGAQILGKGSDLGTVEVGKTADLVILSADPLADIRNTQKIDFVIQSGNLLPASDLDVSGEPNAPNP